MPEDKSIYVNGVLMPFEPEELLRVLKVLKKSMEKAGESFDTDEDSKIMDSLLNQLNNI